MAEIMETMEQKEVPSMAKANAGLTLGIIGTSLSALTALGGLGSLSGLFGGKSNSNTSNAHTFTDEEVYLERQLNQNVINTTKEFYENRLTVNRELAQAFFDSYQRDVDNSFKLYKYTRDEDDKLKDRIEAVDKKVDMLTAIRPYQDAFIDQKINTNALIADFNLARRTCKMIEGQLVLPSTPTITGFGSYNPFASSNGTTVTA